MEYRQLGRSGLKVPALSLGTGTFGGGNEFFKAWGTPMPPGASTLVDICLDAGLTMFDSADIYSAGLAEGVLGAAIKGRRDKVLISTKATFRHGDGPNDVGSSRFHLIRACRRQSQKAGDRLYRLVSDARLRRDDPDRGGLSALDNLVQSRQRFAT